MPRPPKVRVNPDGLLAGIWICLWNQILDAEEGLKRLPEMMKCDCKQFNERIRLEDILQWGAEGGPIDYALEDIANGPLTEPERRAMRAAIRKLEGQGLVCVHGDTRATGIQITPAGRQRATAILEHTGVDDPPSVFLPIDDSPKCRKTPITRTRKSAAEVLATREK